MLVFLLLYSAAIRTEMDLYKSMATGQTTTIIPSFLLLYLDNSLYAQLLNTMSSSSGFEHKQYFVPGFGISRHIIFGHIQYYLGPSASVRPYQYQV